jgi:archaellum biogenesis ATPase FlaH
MLAPELKQVNQWIVWKDNKKPHSAITMKPTGWQKEENWTSYKEALRICKECGFKGLGFVFKFPYVGIDLDDCIEEDGMMNDLARKITNEIDTYTEYSKSGKGLHLYCKVTEPIEALKTSTVEVYGEGRFFIVTGKELDADQLEVKDQTRKIKELILQNRPVKEKTIQPKILIEGERNNSMTAHIGRLFNYYDKDTVFNLAHTLNQTICNPPLPDEELNTIIDSISKRDVKQITPRLTQQTEQQYIIGKRDLDTIPYQGISKKIGKYISTGMESLDYALNDLAPGCVTLLAGRSNCGKSTFVKQVIANAINTDNKVFIIHGEGAQEMLINALYECVIGRDRKFYNTIKVNKRFHKEPTADTLKALQEWHKGKLTMFDRGEQKFVSTNELFELIEEEVKASNTNLIVIDNLMSCLKSSAAEKNEAQSDFMQRCHDLAQKHKTHIILVLHPNKEYRKGVDFDIEMISGSSDLYNKADNIIAVVREYDEAKIQEGRNGQVSLIKNRYYPDLIKFDTKFDTETGLLLEIKDGQAVMYDFKWLEYMEESKRNPPKDWWETVSEQVELNEKPPWERG